MRNLAAERAKEAPPVSAPPPASDDLTCIEDEDSRKKDTCIKVEKQPAAAQHVDAIVVDTPSTDEDEVVTVGEVRGRESDAELIIDVRSVTAESTEYGQEGMLSSIWLNIFGPILDFRS